MYFLNNAIIIQNICGILLSELPPDKKTIFLILWLHIISNQ